MNISIQVTRENNFPSHHQKKSNALMLTSLGKYAQIFLVYCENKTSSWTVSTIKINMKHMKPTNFRKWKKKKHLGIIFEILFFIKFSTIKLKKLKLYKKIFSRTFQDFQGQNFSPGHSRTFPGQNPPRFWCSLLWKKQIAKIFDSSEFIG